MPSRMVGVSASVNLPCTIKSRSSLLALAHLGGPGKRAVKRLWCAHQQSQNNTVFLHRYPGCVYNPHMPTPCTKSCFQSNKSSTVHTVVYPAPRRQYQWPCSCLLCRLGPPVTQISRVNIQSAPDIVKEGSE